MSDPADAGLILTATSAQARQQARQARAARASRDEAGRGVWHPPQVMQFNTWMVEAWLSLWPETQLLGPVHELLLYREAMRSSDLNLLDPMQICRAARSAASLTAEYDLDPQQWQPESEEQAAFQSWYATVASRMRESGWVTRREVVNDLVAALQTGAWLAPADIRLVGVVVSPLQQRLLDALSAQGTSIQGAKAATAAALSALTFPDPESQYRAVASVINAQAHGDEGLIIALPRIDAHTRTALDAVLVTECAPLSQTSGEYCGMRPWRYEQAPSLDQHPWVATALDVLAVRGYGNDAALLSRLLMNRSLWGPEQSAQMALADWRLRQDGTDELALATLIRKLENAGANVAGLHGLLAAVGGEPRRALPSAWSARFQTRLAAIGLVLPQESIDADGFQAAEAWQEALNLLASLDLVAGELSAADALQWLREVCAQRHHQTATGFTQPVRIVEYADLAGMSAKHICILDANDSAFPFGMIATPFLPSRELLAKGAAVTPEAAMWSVIEWLETVQSQCQQLSVLAAMRDALANETLPAPIFSWQAADLASMAEDGGYPEPAALSVPQCDPAPPVQNSVAEGIGGGSGLLRDYAAAPFIAFAKRRLRCDSFPEQVGLLDASRQGKLLHRSLEFCWDELKNSDALQSCDDSSLHDLAASCAERACSELLHGVGKLLLQMEIRRLTDVVVGWLAHEMRREHDFEVVKHEHPGTVNLPGLDLGYRIDRIDRVETSDGSRILLLDYKTGGTLPAPSCWDTESLTEPQLPFYAAYADLSDLGIERVHGIAFAHVREGSYRLSPQTSFTGLLIRDSNKSLKGDGFPDWDERVEKWRAAIDEMAAAFVAGDHRYDALGKYLTDSDRNYDAFLAPLMRNEVPE